MKPKILITNDDGIYAPGIKHLWRALSNFADLAIVAPNEQRSGCGLGLTLNLPLTIQPVAWEKNCPAWKVDGTPADCVRLGLSMIIDFKPDLIVSGINRGSNAGRNALYSGTVGGVIEGALRGIFGIAFSCENFMDPDYAACESYVLDIVSHFLHAPHSQGTVLNVTFPDKKTFKGMRIARQGMGFWVESPEKRLHPDGDFHYYWHGMKWSHHDEHEESDVRLTQEGYISAVPLQVHQLTHNEFFDHHKKEFNKKF